MGARVIFYAIIVIICIVAISIGVYVQFFYKYAEVDQFMLGNVDRNALDNEQYTNLKNSFENIFNNTVGSTKTISPHTKIDANKNIIYSIKDADQRERQYSINFNIPVINIQSEVINKINAEVESIFHTKVKSIKSSADVYTVYNVSYVAYVNENIISIAIKATLKEGNNPQRIIIQTYNYDIEQDKLLTLFDVMEQANLTLVSIQSKIDKEISNINKQNIALEQAGYSVFKRDENSDMYEAENSNNFFISKEGYLYIIYAYGNSAYTSELDLVII